MTRPLPLAMLALVFLWLATNVDTFWMWVIAIVAGALLVALIVAMRFQNMYKGPASLAEDLRRASRRVMRDEGGEADRVIASRERMENEDERRRVISDLEDRDAAEREARRIDLDDDTDGNTR
jgi:hypothetical protein